MGQIKKNVICTYTVLQGPQYKFHFCEKYENLISKIFRQFYYTAEKVSTLQTIKLKTKECIERKNPKNIYFTLGLLFRPFYSKLRYIRKYFFLMEVGNYSQLS